MKYVVTLIHPVDDFERWKAAVVEMDPAISHHMVAREVYQSLDDPNEVLVQVEVESPEAAVAHLSDEIRQELDRAGVEFYPPAFAGREVVELRIERAKG